MRVFMSPDHPNRRADAADMMKLFGVKGKKWPDWGCPARHIQGIWVHVLPIDHVLIVNRRGRPHRVIASCPDCGAGVPAGRMHQHLCDAARTVTERKRRAEFKRESIRSNLRVLALNAFATPDDTQERDDAVNHFCEKAGECMTVDQFAEWDKRCLKATEREIVNEALRILDLRQIEAPLPEADDAWNPAAHGG